MPKPRDPLLLAEEIHRLVGRTRRRLWLATSRCLEERGESPFRWHLVCYIVRYGPTTQIDLAYALAQHPAGVSRLVEELESIGFITRKHDPDDRRKLLVHVTKKGEAWFDSVAPHVNAAALEAMSNLGPSERVDLRMHLKKLLGEPN